MGKRRAMVLAVVGATIGVSGPAGTAVAMTATAPRVASAASKAAGCKVVNLGQVRFDLTNASVQVCARSGRSFAFRAATAAEARAPYAAYFRPMSGAAYVDVPTSVAGLIVKTIAPLFQDQSGKALFSGFAAAGLRSTPASAGNAVFDTLMVVMPLTALARSAVQQAELQSELAAQGEPVSIAGRTLALVGGAYIYGGRSSMVVFAAVADQATAQRTIASWITAHPGA